MRKQLILIASILTLPLVSHAEGEDEPRALSGMSIMGDNEAPKSLVIVPWKGSELGRETDLNANLLNDGMAPIDKEVFMRQLDFYEVSETN